ncbi:heme lyase CcmF/NrfE family subunit [Albidovulum sp.]
MDLSLATIAEVALALALALSLLAAGLAVAAGRQRDALRLTAARNAVLAVAVLVSLAFAILFHAFIVSDFSLSYVAQNSNLSLPMVFKIAGVWGAHEGSLLMWAWFLAMVSAAAVVLHWREAPLSMPWVIATLGVIEAGFLALVVLFSNPFARLLPVPADGRDLNPLLQDLALAFHPPMLYLGYVGFSIPFAFAMAALVRQHVGGEWVTAVRRWTLFSWLALTTGIVFGGYWAYYELGWGGWWAWDPVENASFMPWLTGTALMHSMMAQERRGMFRLWNMFLVIATFLLTLLGAFLVRSGVLTSVHSFAADPARGAYLLAFLGLAMVAGFGLLLWRAETLESDAEVESPLSREAGLLANNVLLVVGMLIVMAGTLAPLAVEVLTGARISVAAPYFNRVMVPLFLVLLVLMALGPALPWRAMPADRFLRQFRPAFAAAGLGLAAALALGVRDPVTLAAVAAATMAGAATLADLARSVAARRRVAGSGWGAALLRSLIEGRRRTGGLIVHLAIVVMAIGMIGSGLFQQARTLHMAPGQATRIAGYTLTLRGIDTVEGPNWTAREARFSVSREGRVLAVMTPQVRFHPGREMSTTKIAIRSELAGDLYIFFGGEEEGAVVAQIYWNPLVGWVRGGWLLLVAGALMALSEPRALRRRRAAAVSQGVPAE